LGHFQGESANYENLAFSVFLFPEAIKTHCISDFENEHLHQIDIYTKKMSKHNFFQAIVRLGLECYNECANAPTDR